MNDKTTGTLLLVGAIGILAARVRARIDLHLIARLKGPFVARPMNTVIEEETPTILRPSAVSPAT